MNSIVLGPKSELPQLTTQASRPSRQGRVQFSPARWLALCVLAWLASGCASGGRLQEFQQVSAIGTDYIRALDGALIKTGQLAIQANSLEILANRELAQISRQDLARQDGALREFLEELALVRAQVLALGDYFNALGALAGSKAPGQFAAGLNQSADSLAAISGTLDQRLGSGTFAGVGTGLAAGAAIGEIAIEKRRMRDLQRELEERHPIVDKILELQEQLLAVLIGVAQDDQEFVGEASYDAKVIAPLTDSTAALPCTPLWLTDRQAALLAGSLPAQLELVAEATRKLRVTWGRLLDNEVGLLEFPELSKAVSDALAGPVGIPAPAPPTYWHCS